MKKLFVVSDVHGYYSILKEALDRAGFDGHDQDHILVCCGDYFDKGSENQEVLKFFERLERKVLLRGNHEDMLLKLLCTGKMQPHHYINGTPNTLVNFFGKYCVDPVDHRVDFCGKTRVVDRLCEFIEETVDYYETEEYVFVHGWLPENGVTAEGRNSATKEAWEKARWVKWIDRYTGERPLPDKTLICGHVPTFCSSKYCSPANEAGDTIVYGNGLIAIDAGTYDSQKINVLVLELDDDT